MTRPTPDPLRAADTEGKTTMTTLTSAEADRIRDWLATHHIPKGLGTSEEACSIGSLALTGTLTDDIPACMSEVIGRWIIVTQDRISDKARNSFRWKAALALAAGTGREREQEYLAIILDWMWERLALVQSIADQGGYGPAWATMLHERTAAAARAASASAYAYSVARTVPAAAAAGDASAYAYANADDYGASATALLERLVTA